VYQDGFPFWDAYGRSGALESSGIAQARQNTYQQLAKLVEVPGMAQNPPPPEGSPFTGDNLSNYWSPADWEGRRIAGVDSLMSSLTGRPYDPTQYPSWERSRAWRTTGDPEDGSRIPDPRFVPHTLPQQILGEEEGKGMIARDSSSFSPRSVQQSLQPLPQRTVDASDFPNARSQDPAVAEAKRKMLMRMAGRTR
jgi:hypothetical protein